MIKIFSILTVAIFLLVVDQFAYGDENHSAPRASREKIEEMRQIRRTCRKLHDKASDITFTTKSPKTTKTPAPTPSPTHSPTPPVPTPENPLHTIAEFVCLPAYKNWFESICELITLFEPVNNLLSENGPGGVFTFFAPTNVAIDNLLLRNLDKLYDASDPDVRDYFTGLGIDIDTALVGQYLLGPTDGVTSLALILLQAIIPIEIPATDLTCWDSNPTFSGQDTQTFCDVTRGNLPDHTVIGQIGPGNDVVDGDIPHVYPGEYKLQNGIVLAVDRVILPHLGILPDPHTPTTSF